MRVLRVILVLWWGGVGLALLGKPVRGLAWIGALLAAVALSALVTPWLLVLFAAVYLGCLVDTAIHAWRTDVWPGVDAACIGVFVAEVAGALLLRAFVVEGFRNVSTSMMPTLAAGDHVWVNKLSRHFGTPARGDVVAHVYPCDADRDYLKRVIGLPGDTIEIRCHVLYVNGTAVPSERVSGACSYDDGDPGDPDWQARPCSRYRETLDGHTYDIFDDPDRPAHEHFADDRDFPQADHAPPSCANEEPGRALLDVAPGQVVATPATDPCAPQLHYVVPADEVFVLGDNRHNSNDSRFYGGVPLSAIKGRATSIWLPGHQSQGIGTIH